MPELLRPPNDLTCSGVDWGRPIDSIPPGRFPNLSNIRVTEEGALTGRPGYSSFASLSGSDYPNSIRALNDPSGQIFVGGGGTKLYSGPSGSYASVDTGYSGNPLSLIPFRPLDSPSPWMYVYDSNKLVKVNHSGSLQPVGYAPPGAPEVEYAVPAVRSVAADSDSGWVAYNAAGGPSNVARNSSSPKISSIAYLSGSTGWALIAPSVACPWAGPRMTVVLNSGGGNQENVLVREVNAPISSTTIAGIAYDSGASGLCSITLASSVAGIARNSLITLNSTETVRVLAVIPSPDGSSYSIRCSTSGTFAAGQTVAGVLSFFVYTLQTHSTTETITINSIEANTTGAGTADVALLTSENISTAFGRAISVADDYLHISMFFSVLDNISAVNLYIDVDAGTTSVGGSGNAFTGNYYLIPLPVTSLNIGWNELNIPLVNAQRFGNDLTRTLANVQAIQVEVVTTGAVVFNWDCWYLFGTYGPTIQPNSPEGMLYISRFRDSATGAHSVPGPSPFYQLFPLREGVVVTPTTTSQSGVDTVDTYRLGGTVSSFLYVSSCAEGGSFTDSLPDSAVLEVNQPPDLTALQPWPLLAAPLAGVCNVVGTSVVRTSGSIFPSTLLSNTVIQINGVGYQTTGAPLSSSALAIQVNAGTLTAATFSIPSPTVAGQSLQFAFGALEGPFSPVIFALGDPLNQGILYWTNFSDADSASDQNSLELASPSEPLVSGAVWNGLVFAGTRDKLFLIRYTFQALIGTTSAAGVFQYAELPTTSGIWSRWACCSTPEGVAFLGRDGIYLATSNGAQKLNLPPDNTDPLYLIFPHDGQAAQAFVRGGRTIYPVDMTQLSALRLSYGLNELRFSYLDTNGGNQTLVFDIPHKRWLPWNFANGMATNYLIEESASGTANRMLLLPSAVASIFLAGGNTDNGSNINSLILTPSSAGGDSRAQKLYMDSMIEAVGSGTLNFRAGFNFASTFTSSVPIALTSGLVQTPVALASLTNLALWLNICAEFTFTGGPGGPAVLQFQPAFYAQPILTPRYTIQFQAFGNGWKHLRRVYPAYISTASITLTILTQDGRSYGPFTLPSTGGTFGSVPQMLPAGIKDTSMSFMLDGGGTSFAVFPPDFCIEAKPWTGEGAYALLPILSQPQ